MSLSVIHLCLLCEFLIVLHIFLIVLAGIITMKLALLQLVVMVI